MTTNRGSDPTPNPRASSGQRDDEPDGVAPPAGSIADLYRDVLPVLHFEAEQTKWDIALTVAARDIHDMIAASHRDQRLSMDLLRNLTAVDWEDEGIEVVYHLYSTRHRHAVELKTRLPLGAQHLPTITDIYRGAEWAEREAREMFGIEFDGHPDPRNLLLDEDLDIHPLLKSHPLAPMEVPQGADVDVFRKEHPMAKPEPSAEDAERAKRLAAAKQTAAAGADRKPDSELTPEERAEKKAAQTERVKRARELAAARRAERAAGAPPAGAATAPAAEAGAATDPPAAAAAAPATEAARPAAANAPPAGPASSTIPKASADMTPEEQAERKAAQAERVKRGRELAAARRAELRGDG